MDQESLNHAISVIIKQPGSHNTNITINLFIKNVTHLCDSCDHKGNAKDTLKPENSTTYSVTNVIIKQLHNHTYKSTLHLYTKVRLMLVINVMSCIHMAIVGHERTILYKHPTKYI